MKLSQSDDQMIKDSIAGKLKLDPQQKRNVLYYEKSVPPNNRPLLALSQVNRPLYGEIMKDKFVRKIGAYYFFPMIEAMLEKKNAELEWFGMMGTMRQIMVIGNRTESEYYFIKPTLHSNEREIACKAAELRIGPKQHATLDGYLTEEYITGKAIGAVENLSEGNIYVLGAKIGNAFYKLHCEGIAYNNINAMAPAKSESTVVFPDFGRSVVLGAHKEFSDEEIGCLVMNDFPFSFAVEYEQGGNGRPQLSEDMKGQIREELAGKPAKEFFVHDIRAFYGRKIAPLFQKQQELEAFKDGFKDAYLV